MYEKTSEMAKVMHGAGVRQNDVISIISENRHEYPAIALGAFYLNAIVAPINVTYTERKFNRPSSLSSVRSSRYHFALQFIELFWLSEVV